MYLIPICGGIHPLYQQKPSGNGVGRQAKRAAQTESVTAAICSCFKQSFGLSTGAVARCLRDWIFGSARRGVSGSLHQQPATAGPNSSPRRRCGQANRGAASKVGSDAMVACEPRQGRKTATVSLMFHVPSGCLAGASTAARKPMSFVEARCTAFLSV